MILDQPDQWDADDLYEFHWLLKYLGQIFCRHGIPACAHCPLGDLCPAYASDEGESIAPGKTVATPR